MLLAKPTGSSVSLPDRPTVSIRALTDSPDLGKYTGLQLGVFDDELLATILAFKEQNPDIPSDDVLLVSEDSGLIMKARARGVAVLMPPDSLRLEDEPTADQRKIAALERRLAELQQKEPSLSLRFATDDSESDQLSIKILPWHDLTKEEIERQYNEEVKAMQWTRPQQPGAGDLSREAVPNANTTEHISKVVLEASNAFSSMIDMRNMYSDKEIERYRTEVDAYLARFQGHLIDVHRWGQLKNRMRTVHLILRNDGTIPAEGVVVQLVIPDEIRVYDDDNAPRGPGELHRPQRPMTMFEQMNLSTRFAVPYISDLGIAEPPTAVDPDTLGPTITPFNSHLVEWERTKVKHHMPLLLTPLVLVLPIVEGEVAFAIRYTLLADNLAQPATGSLQLYVRLE